MPRLLSARMARALKSGAPRAVLCKIDHPTGMFYCWSGVGTLEYSGQDWIGIGVLGSIAPVRITSELAIQEVKFSMSGVQPEALALIEGSVRNREAEVYLACLDDGLRVVADPWLLILAQLDYQRFSTQEDGSAMIEIIARSGFWTLERGIDEVWSPENQKLRFPGDTGLDMLPSLEKQEIAWTET